jgi:hypothetical protein
MCDKCLNEISDDVETIEGEALDEQLFDDEGNPVEDS